MKNWWMRWRKFRAISTVEKMAFTKAVFVLLLIKIGLKLLPFTAFKRLFAAVSATTHHETSSKIQQDIQVKSILRAANLLPFSVTCLPKALALKLLLKKDDAILLKIGVQRNVQNEAIEAHAWVEKNNVEILIGYLPEFNYLPLWEWK